MVMKACIIFHNMIMEDKREEDIPVDDYNDTFNHIFDSAEVNTSSPSHGSYAEHVNYLSRFFDICDRGTHRHLKIDRIKRHFQIAGAASSQPSIRRCIFITTHFIIHSWTSCSEKVST